MWCGIKAPSPLKGGGRSRRVGPHPSSRPNASGRRLQTFHLTICAHSAPALSYTHRRRGGMLHTSRWTPIGRIRVISAGICRLLAASGRNLAKFGPPPVKINPLALFRRCLLELGEFVSVGSHGLVKLAHHDESSASDAAMGVVCVWNGDHNPHRFINHNSPTNQCVLGRRAT